MVRQSHPVVSFALKHRLHIQFHRFLRKDDKTADLLLAVFRLEWTHTILPCCQTQGQRQK